MTRVCSQCGAMLQVLNTKIVGDSRIRYYGCRSCGFRPPKNKRIVPLEYAPPRVAAISSTAHSYMCDIRVYNATER